MHHEQELSKFERVTVICFRNATVELKKTELNSPPQTLQKPSQGAHCSPKESNSSLSLQHCAEQSEPSMLCPFSFDHPTLS